MRAFQLTSAQADAEVKVLSLGGGSTPRASARKGLHNVTRSATMIYTHGFKAGGLGVKSPLDALPAFMEQ
jgi:hypothetical protein